VFPFTRPAPPQDKAREVLDRAVGLLRRYERAGATALPVADVLEMLGAGPDEAAPAQAPSRDPRADPLTGARWAGPPGSTPPES
jgi:hypothetical protein